MAGLLRLVFVESNTRRARRALRGSPENSSCARECGDEWEETDLEMDLGLDDEKSI